MASFGHSLAKMAGVSALAITLALGAGATSSAQGDNVLRVANFGEPDSLDPHRATGVWENRIIGDMFLGLTTEGPDGTVVPGAAETWTVSEDGRTFVFKLRDHNWSDGTPVTADDFVYSLRRIVDPALAAQYASLLYPIKNSEALNTGELEGMENLGVRAIDDKTLEITLEAPTPYFISQLTHYTAWPVPRHVVEVLGDDWTNPGNLVSNGAYTLTEWVPNGHVRIVKNPGFYDVGNVSIDEVVFFPGEDRSAGQKRFRAGEVDVATDFASDQIKFLRRNLDNETRIAPYLGIYYYPINTKKPPFDDVRVRQALSMAVNREAITDKVLQTGEVPAYSFVPPGTDNYGEPSFVEWRNVDYAERVQRATALLAEAGFGPDNPLKMTLRYNTSENHKKIAVAVASMWKQLGVEAELFNTEVKVHYNDLQGGDFQVARAGWIADYNDPQNFLYLLQQSTGPLNYGQYDNPEFESLMQQAAQTADLNARANLLGEAEAIAMDDQPLIPIYYYVSKNLVSDRVQGWVDNTKDIHRTRWLSLAQ